jgi:integrase
VFEPATEQHIIGAARQPFRDIFVIMMDAGCRSSEVLAIRWEDLR